MARAHCLWYKPKAAINLNFSKASRDFKAGINLIMCTYFKTSTTFKSGTDIKVFTNLKPGTNNFKAGTDLETRTN